MVELSGLAGKLVTFELALTGSIRGDLQVKDGGNRRSPANGTESLPKPTLPSETSRRFPHERLRPPTLSFYRREENFGNYCGPGCASVFTCTYWLSSLTPG